MGINIDKILAYSGNKYEKTAAMIKYARYLAQKHEDALEIPVNRHSSEKITVMAINDILTEKIVFYYDNPAEEMK